MLLIEERWKQKVHALHVRYNVTDVNGISSMNQSYVVEEIGKMETKVRAYMNEAGQFQCGKQFSRTESDILKVHMKA